MMGVFVLYYHRVYPEGPAPDITLRFFEWEMRYLKRHYQILSLDDLLAYMRGELLLERYGVAVTFDDGWFDNFVYAYPIMKKHGIRGTIFVSTGKIEDRGTVRPTIESCWNGKADFDVLQSLRNIQEANIASFNGDFSEFLTWEELRVMQKSGIFSVQSHGIEHRKVYSGDKIEGFLNSNTDWADISATADTSPGVPLYPIKSAIGARAYIPSQEVNDCMASYVAGHGGKITEKGLFEKVEGLKSVYPGQWETEEEMKDRIRKELTGSRESIYSEVGVWPEHFCWPWGQYNDAGIEIAKEVGYRACYTTVPGCITPETSPYRMPRVSVRSGKLKFIKRGIIYTRPSLSKLYCKLTGRNK